MKDIATYPFATLLSKPGDIASAAYKAIIHCIAMLLASMARLPEAFAAETQEGPDGTLTVRIPADKAAFASTLLLRNGMRGEPLWYALVLRGNEPAAVNFVYRWRKTQYTLSADDIPYDTLAALASSMYARLQGMWPTDESHPDTAEKTWSCDVILPLSLHLEGIAAADADEAGRKARAIALHTDLCDWGDDFSYAEVMNVGEE